MNRRHTIGDSVESVDRVVFHKNSGEKPMPEQASSQPEPVLSNGGVAKKTMRSHSTTSDSDFNGVMINFTANTKDTALTDTSLSHLLNHDVSTPTSTNDEVSPIEETVAEKSLPWRDNGDPSPTHLSDSIPNNEPVVAHVPSWVNNLSYSHITETGSPYVSPQATIIPQSTNYHKTVYSIFTPNVEEDDKNLPSTKFSDYFPPPWAPSTLEDHPQVSPMVMESGARSDDLLHVSHSDQAPDHHHVIVPTIDIIDSSNSSDKNVAHLTAVASAPDFQHWKPLQKGFLFEDRHNESDTMLSEMAFAEGVKSRVQEWLKQANDEEENDADEENDDTLDNLESAEALEYELDLAMNSNSKG